LNLFFVSFMRWKFVDIRGRAIPILSKSQDNASDVLLNLFARSNFPVSRQNAMTKQCQAETSHATARRSECCSAVPGDNPAESAFCEGALV
jgi:hypothetical protein